MFDIHSHVLPGIDDGAADLDEAVAMCRLAAADGIEAIVTTPHQRTASWQNLDPGRLDFLREQVADQLGETPRLLPGGEIRVDRELLDDFSAPDRGGILPLANSRYLLLELDRRDPYPPVRELVHELLVDDWIPVLAHPEFIPALGGDLRLMAELAERGALFQITAMSVTGEAGSRARRLCHKMLDLDLVDFVASDCHGIEWRPPGLSAAREAIAKGWGEATARALTVDNPRAVVENRPAPRPAAY